MFFWTFFILTILNLCSSMVQRFEFQSVLNENMTRYVLYNELPEKCRGLSNVPYSVFLTGFGGTPEAYNYVPGLLNQLIENNSVCCSYVFIPEFDISPLGGWWYTDNLWTLPEEYLFHEVIDAIEKSSPPGPTLSKERDHRVLMGHSMGGYGALMNSFRSKMQTFGSTCAFAGAAYTWDLPETRENLDRAIVAEAVMKQTEFRQNDPENCNFTGPPYRYYIGGDTFFTWVLASTSLTFNGDHVGVRPNSPWIPSGPDPTSCTEYTQYPNMAFWLTENGTVDENLFTNGHIRNSPYSYLQLNNNALVSAIGAERRIFLSAGLQDDLVNYTEIQAMADLLQYYGIDIALDIHEGGHSDIQPSIQRCWMEMSNRTCSPIDEFECDEIASENSKSNKKTKVALIVVSVFLGLFGVALVATTCFILKIWHSKSGEYKIME